MGGKILIVTSFYPPERGAASNRIYNMAKGLYENGFDVEVVCPLPNYPSGKIFPEYRGRLNVTEVIDGVKVRRYWIYPSISKNPLMRLVSMLSFSLSLILMSWKLRSIKPDYCIIQGHPLFVSWTATVISKLILKCKIFLNVSDIWPLSALEIGVLRRGRMYALLEKIERFNYRWADAVIGQSNEILEHVKKINPNKPLFLYRNLPPKIEKKYRQRWREGGFHLVYAGLLGYAQGIADIVKKIDWVKIGVKLSIYGDGGDKREIEEYLSQNESVRKNVELHGMVSSSELNDKLAQYHVALVPLATRIQGAVPSKLYELAHQGMPVIFSGGGEGAQIVKNYGLGLLSPPGDIDALQNNICEFLRIKEAEYARFVASCHAAAQDVFDFSLQMDNLSKFVCGFKS